MTDGPKMSIFVLPGGTLPRRQTEGAIGYDVHLRAIVSATRMDPANPKLRQTIFDFKNRPGDTDPEELEAGRHVEEKDNKFVYRLDPRESVLVGIGFVTEMPFPFFYWVAPRSGLAAKWKLTVTNAPGTVDPDYRGEAGVLIHNLNDRPFPLEHNMRIAQIIFAPAIIPELHEVDQYSDLRESPRGAGGFGSTGLR